MRVLKVMAGCCALVLFAGCSSAPYDSSEAQPREPLPQRLAQIKHDLALGSTGADVQALHEYFTAYGYFQNYLLQEEYPEWRPIVADEPADLSVFDQSTELAVREFQRNFALLESGVVDANTRDMLVLPRCGVPDGMQSLDPANKYLVHPSKWAHTNLTWKMANADDVTLAEARAAAQLAFASWSAVTNLSFTEVTGSFSADIGMLFTPLIGQPASYAAVTAYPDDGGDMRIDPTETWSVASPTPGGSVDLQSVLVHELGHALGLKHSTVSSNAVMFASISTGVQRRSLHVDDRIAISALYDTWVQLPGCAKAIGVGAAGTGAAWVIGCASGANGTAHYWNGSSWVADSANGVGKRIDVGPNGIPWLVHSNGNIYRRSSSSVSSGSWTQVTGCAKDITAGGDGSVWIVGCSSSANGLAHKWNSSTSTWTADAANGVGSRIAVGSSGVPWMVHSDGKIYRRSSSNVSSGSWVQLPGAGRDIAIGDNKYAWLIGTGSFGSGSPIFAFQEESDPDPDPEDVYPGPWVKANGGAVEIDVAPDNSPWVVDSTGAIWRTTK
jgi:hypothetical protein